METKKVTITVEARTEDSDGLWKPRRPAVLERVNDLLIVDGVYRVLECAFCKEDRNYVRVYLDDAPNLIISCSDWDSRP